MCTILFLWWLYLEPATWNPWTLWSGCSTSCGPGRKRRSRTCKSHTNPEQFQGRCEGESNQTKTCNIRRCPGETTS